MSKKVRVRFAPSPTGALHIGGVRTALFNYLFAKKHGGDFLLRIEDTDQNRYVEGAEKYIIDALNWCGIPYDEGVGKEGKHAPYRQSERKAIYKQYAETLIKNGWAYYAFDTAESLENQRKSHEEAGKTFIYNWHNRQKLANSLALSAEETQKRLERGDDYVIRFKMPEQEILHMHDLIRGEVVVDTQTLDDKILFKSDGMPTYHLANIVDDHLMEISHVIRGEEWLPSLPLHLLLYRAFGWEAPTFAHLPLILKPVGNGKLSKRDGQKLGFPVFPMQWKDASSGDILKGFKEEGYLPEALINFLALLGWNPGNDTELFSIEQLITLFDLERVHKAGARFDPEKIKWFNHQYLQQKPVNELAEDFRKILEEKNIKTENAVIEKVIQLIRERASFVADFWDLSNFFFVAPSHYDEKALKKQWKENTAEILREVTNLLRNSENFTSEPLEALVKNYIETHKYGLGQVMPPLRLALVGEMKGPHIFDIMEIIGKEETISRLLRFLEKAEG
ncbi:glutamate--tRNA ligase [Capnocytophaga canimorsus]|uniref:glutamate--tRNA ligase n=1 Tax=Capnocytophaga canimorsus TaxID=28188 RepID=UPI000D6E8BAA|nr:glutamate--tRNA ligase [Capnocytophaga canimorsus]AWL78647.1 glutamate--tRNA ligase [Capnocytophaga canimorsus]AYW37259.1 glutamate--tRNA ligase [Capnocytophaga canimorsus]MDT9500020.1 glutamate--tRNA ligase [Capnocytophaga canimorsus]